MSFIFSGLLGEGGKTQTPDETIDKLCDRVVHATLLEDRRAAVLGLKGLSRQYQLEVGTKGMSILLHILHQDRVDPEVAKAVLETLINLCDANTTPSEKKDENLGIQFTEIFIKDPSNVSLLLSLLAEQDFHVRFNDIDLLKILLKNNRKQLQDAILTSPMGMSRLMDLLDDGREVIRNEGLLLLIDLTFQNADIQKIITFENAFERLFQIAYEEGGCDGDVIVQDCLQLVQNLLADNVSNQNYFRESGLIPRIKNFFKIPDIVVSQSQQQQQRQLFLISHDGGGDSAETYRTSPWTHQKAKNIEMMLRVIRLMVSRDNPNTQTNQLSMFQSGIVKTVLQMALMRDVPAATQAESFQVLAEITRGNETVQNLLSNSIVEDSVKVKNTRPLIEHVVAIMVNGGDFHVRSGAHKLLVSYLRDNISIQKVLLSTSAPPPDANPNDDPSSHPQSAGSLLFTALLDWEASRKDPWRSWFASFTLSLTIFSPHCKDLALTLKVPDSDADLVDFMYAVCHSLSTAIRQSADVHVIVGFYVLICSFLHFSPKAVQHFLSEASNFSFLIEQISQVSGNPILQGLAAYVLGTIFEFNDDSVQSLSRSAMQSIIINRVGADQFVSRLSRLKDCREMKDAEAAATGSVKLTAEDQLFTAFFVDLFKSNYETMQKSVVNPNHLKLKQQEKEESRMQENVIASYKSVISTQDKEIAQLKSRLKELEVSSPPNQPQPAPLKSPVDVSVLQARDRLIEELQGKVAGLEMRVQELTQQCDKATRDRDDALVFLAEQDSEIAHYKNRLRELGEDIQDEDDEDEEDEEAQDFK